MEGDPMRESWHKPFLSAMLALGLLGCSTAGLPHVQLPSFSVDRQAVIERLAHPSVSDWSSGHVTSPEVDRLRQSEPRDEAERRLMAVGQVWDASSVSLAGTSSTGIITSAPAYSFWTKQVFWITDKGWLLKRDLLNSTSAAWQISTTDTFPRTGITLSNDGKRAYLCSLQGNFYAIDTTTGAAISGTPVAMG